MNRIVSIIAASALISAALVGGLAAANGSRAITAEAAATEAAPAWTSPPAIEAGCRLDCAAANPARKVRVIAIDGRDWPAGQAAAQKTASR